MLHVLSQPSSYMPSWQGWQSGPAKPSGQREPPPLPEAPPLPREGTLSLSMMPEKKAVPLIPTKCLKSRNEIHWASPDVHVHPGSISHVTPLQPSPSSAFPSSQVSDPATRPSPHTGMQTSEEEEKSSNGKLHTYPHSTEHCDEHPSPAIALPSSHDSNIPSNPSPQTQLPMPPQTPHSSQTFPAQSHSIPSPHSSYP